MSRRNTRVSKSNLNRPGELSRRARDAARARREIATRAIDATIDAMRVAASTALARARPAPTRANARGRTTTTTRATTTRRRATRDETTYDDAHRVRVTASHDETTFTYEFDAEPLDAAIAATDEDDDATTTRAAVDATRDATIEGRRGGRGDVGRRRGDDRGRRRGGAQAGE